ncbi:GntR family transcriptional regulator [Streptomyces sp. NPDC000594]|uniref:GntR family transcriptional regulator n=1 Tax=Streptomyces sp. NPDC000594 TaxID=3154261 RepID=UPI00332385CE
MSEDEQLRVRLGFREIAAALRGEILDRRYPTGSVLPPEPELALKCGVSRSPVNRAMAGLTAEGLVRPRQERGTVVTWLPPIPHSPTAGHDPASDLRALGLEPRYEVAVEQAEQPAAVTEPCASSAGRPAVSSAAAGCSPTRSP